MAVPRRRRASRGCGWTAALVWGVWAGSVRESGETRCGTSRGADACDRRGSGVLRCSGHGGGEVAAARSFGGGVAMEGSPSAMAKGGGELLCDAWKPARARGGAGRRPRAAAERRFAGGEREQRGRQGKEKTGRFAISEISRDLSVKQG